MCIRDSGCTDRRNTEEKNTDTNKLTNAINYSGVVRLTSAVRVGNRPLPNNLVYNVTTVALIVVILKNKVQTPINSLMQ